MSRFRTEPLLPNDGAKPPDEPATPTPFSQQPTRPRDLFTAPIPPDERPLSDPPARPRQLFTAPLTPEDSPLSHQPTQHAGRATTPYDDRTRPPQARLLTGRVLANKYELGARLGVGGMGEVYRASHLALGIDVAVKVMHPHVAREDEYMRRFRREAHAASLLAHRNVVRVLDFGEDDGLLFLVMELLRGRSLNAWLSSCSTPPPIAEVVEILGQVVDAFEAAHAAGIVHRDLKPENVFLAIEADGRRVAKVVDFGLAHVDDHRDAGPTLTRPDLVSGTPEFMSPEQCRSLAVGPSTDLYAIGCVLTDMLQLAPPFSGNAVEVMTQQMFVPPPPLKRPPSAEPVPPLLEQLRLSLLAKAPEQRPADVREVRRLLGEAASPEANAQRLPGRKPESARGELYAPPPAASGAATPVTVQLVRLVSENTQWTSLTIGLAAQGIAVVDGDLAGAAGASPIQAVVLDAGGDVESAAAWLRGRTSAQLASRGGTPVLVCLADVTAERMSALIAAGAKDILPHPVTSDVLARKVRRATRARG